MLTYITMKFQIPRSQEMILQAFRENIFLAKINNQNGLGFSIVTLKSSETVGMVSEFLGKMASN